MTIDDAIMEVNRDTERELTERTRRKKQSQVNIVQILNHNLGPSHIQSANPAYVDTLVREAIPAKEPPKPAFVKG